MLSPETALCAAHTADHVQKASLGFALHHALSKGRASLTSHILLSGRSR